MKTETLIRALRSAGNDIVSSAESGRSIDERDAARLIESALKTLAEEIAYEAATAAQDEATALRDLR